jgi:hypothetical protein
MPDQQLSPQDISDLHEIRNRLPAEDPRGAKIDALLQASSSPRQYDTSQLDVVQHPTLGTLKFPKDMPYDERNQIIDEELSKHAGASQPSIWSKIGKAIWSTTPAGIAGNMLDRAKADLPDPEARQLENLRAVAKGQPAPNSQLGTTGLRMLRDTINTARSATEPQNVAIMGAAAVAPVATGSLLALHGGTGVAEHAKGAIQGNPEDVQQTLSSAAEMVGGAATARAGVQPGADPALARLRNVVRTSLGQELTPAEAATPRPAGQFQPALANAPREVLQHAAKEGIDLTPFQATESRGAGKLQEAGEHGLGGSKSLSDALEANRAKFGEAVNRFSERVDPQRLGLSEEAAGESIRRSTQTAKDVAHTDASNAFKNLEWAKDTPVDPAPISKQWAELRESLPMGVEDQILAQVPRNMHATVEEMLSPTGMKTPLKFEQGIALRSLFRDLGDVEGLPNRLDAAYKTMTKATDSAMESAAKDAGFDKEWRDANAGWKDYVQKYGDKQSPLYKVLRQQDPAKITRGLMNNGSARDIEILKNEGMTAALEPLKRQVIQDIARNKFTVGRDGLGGYSDSFLKTLFGDGAVKELYLKADLSRRLNWSQNPSNTGGTLLTAEQIGKPSKIARLFAAAKTSMPRDPLSFVSDAKPTPQLLEKHGAILRGEFPEGYYDLQDTQTGGSVNIKKSEFSEEALANKLAEKRASINVSNLSDLARSKSQTATGRLRKAIRGRQVNLPLLAAVAGRKSQ